MATAAESSPQQGADANTNLEQACTEEEQRSTEEAAGEMAAEQNVTTLDPKECGLGKDLSSWLSTELGKIIQECDLSKTTLGTVRAELEQNLGVQAGLLDSQKELVEKMVRKHIKARMEEEVRSAKHRRKSRGTGEKRGHEELQQSPTRLRQSPTRLQQSPARLQQSPARQDGEGPTPKLARKSYKAGPQDLPAELLSVSVAGRPIELIAREFSTGRKGYFAVQTVPVKSGGATYEVQCLVQCAVVRVTSNEEEADAATPSRGQAAATLEDMSEAPDGGAQAKVLLAAEDGAQVTTPKKGCTQVEGPRDVSGALNDID